MSDLHRRGFKLPPTSSEREAAEIIYSTLASGAVLVGESFTAPDDDWLPQWLVLTAAGNGTFITGDLHKHVMTRRVGEFARSRGAVAIGHLHSSWIVSGGSITDARMDQIIRGAQLAGGSLEGVPERREAVLLAVYTAARIEFSAAYITRHDDRPPTLAPFVRLPLDQAEGMMTDPLQAALKRVG